jgi:hypothetical protein
VRSAAPARRRRDAGNRQTAGGRRQRQHLKSLRLIVCALSLSAACTAKAPAIEELTVWQPRGKWAGRAGQQTDPFISTTGQLRITWEARSVSGANAGAFRIILHSDVSGRPLLVAVDRRGPGKDVTYVTEDPRSFFLVIESDGLDWSVEIAEGIPARRSAFAR